jgi:hypothetical protein
LKIKFLLASLKSITFSEKPTSKYYPTSGSFFRLLDTVAVCLVSEIVPKVACNSELAPKADYDMHSAHWKKSANDRRGKSEQKFCSDAALETVFRKSNCS